jgi:2,4-dienoyl-CoA reductase-like NADH-dependent reductase (Old Yellow Enzyme family)
MNAAAVLARPLTLPCGAVLPNRIAKAAMSEGLASASGDPGDRLVRLYATLGVGGAGLLVTGNVMVRPDGVGEPANVIWRPTADLAAWKRWADAAQAAGTPTFVQLNHAGRQVPRTLNAAPVAPSAVPVAIAGAFAKPRALEEDEILAIIHAFGEAAAFSRAAGFAGVQVHAAHGYLASQFLSPLANLRTDRWGGSLDNRMRFLVETCRRIRQAVGAQFPISVKLNSADFLRGGFSIEEASDVARTLGDEGVDLLEVSGGTYERPAMIVAPAGSSPEREAHFLEYARTLRPIVRGPMMLTGGLRTPAAMAAVIEEGAADVVGLARPIALEPELPRQILAGRTEAAPRGRPLPGPLGAVGETAWHQQQLHRIAAGGATDEGASRWGALLRTALGMVTGPSTR